MTQTVTIQTLCPPNEPIATSMKRARESALDAFNLHCVGDARVPIMADVPGPDGKLISQPSGAVELTTTWVIG